MTEDYYPYIKDFFKKGVNIYDVITLPFAGLRKKTVAMIGAAPGAEILDVATGTGKQAFAYAKKGYKVTGIDLSEDMLNFAMKHNKYPNLKLEIADAAKLDYDDNRFDVTSIFFSLHEMPLEIREKVIEEMVRVTKPGGTVVAVDYRLPKNRLLRWFIYNFIKSYESKYYPEFAKNNLPGLLEKHGIKIEAEKIMLLGVGRIIKGIKAG